MSTETATSTSTSLAQPDTSRETYIGWAKPEDRQWTKVHKNQSRPSGELYTQKGIYYQHLDQIDGGLKNGYTWWNQPYFTYLANRDLIQSISGNLDLLARQRQIASDYFLSQDLGKWGIRVESVAWATCAYVVHSDEADVRKCHPQVKLEDMETEFLKVAYSLDMSKNERQKVYHKVQHDFQQNQS
jgi:hypothetical protein